MQNVTVLGNYERTSCYFLKPWVNLPLSQNTKLKTLIFLIEDLVHGHVHRKSWICTQPREIFPLEMNTEIVAPLLPLQHSVFSCIFEVKTPLLHGLHAARLLPGVFYSSSELITSSQDVVCSALRTFADMTFQKSENESFSSVLCISAVQCCLSWYHSVWSASSPRCWQPQTHSPGCVFVVLPVWGEQGSWWGREKSHPSLCLSLFFLCSPFWSQGLLEYIQMGTQAQTSSIPRLVGPASDP